MADSAAAKAAGKRGFDVQKEATTSGTSNAAREDATLVNSFFVSFPADHESRCARGNLRSGACLHPSTSGADVQGARDQGTDCSSLAAQVTATTPVAGPLRASASLARKATFSKKKSPKALLATQESESSSEISSPNEDHLTRNLIDLMDSQRDSQEAEAERTHAVFASSANQYEQLLYDSSDMDESDFMSPPPSYAEVVDSAIRFDSPADPAPQASLPVLRGTL